MRMLARVRRETMEAHPENHTLRELFEKADQLFNKQSRPGSKKASELKLVREIVGELLFDHSVGGVPCIHFGEYIDILFGDPSRSWTILNENLFEVIIDTNE